MPDLKNLPRRQAAKVFVRAILDALDMCPSELARLTGYDPSTVLRYRAGQSVPSRAFTLDLLDKAPNAGFTFEQVARVLGYRWPGSRDPEKYNSFAEYFSATRLLSKRSRDQFAIKLGVPPYVVRELEMGGLPDRKVLLSFARNFTSGITIDDMAARFPTLRPSETELRIRGRIMAIREAAEDSQRARLEEDFAVDLAPLAQRMARKAAWEMDRPEYAEEIWGEGLALTMKRYDPRRGLFFAFLKTNIRSLAKALKWSFLQSGVDVTLRKYGLPVREARDLVTQRLQRSPTEQEIAEYLDLPVAAVEETMQALHASRAIFSDDLEILLRNALQVGSIYWPNAFEEDLRIRRLDELTDGQRELLYLHYLDGQSFIAISSSLGIEEQVVEKQIRRIVRQIGAAFT